MNSDRFGLKRFVFSRFAGSLCCLLYTSDAADDIESHRFSHFFVAGIRD